MIERIAMRLSILAMPWSETPSESVITAAQVPMNTVATRTSTNDIPLRGDFLRFRLNLLEIREFTFWSIGEN